jgi:hypothetical protein
MYAVSSGFLTALRSSAMKVAVKVEANDGTILQVVSGDVQMDATRAITRTCTLEVIASSMSGQELFDYLMTPTLELTVSRGLYVAGSPEYVPLGVFSADTVEMSLDISGVVRFSGSDRSKKISRARFVDPYQIGSSVVLADAMTALLQSRWSPTVTDFSNVDETTTAQTIFEAGDSSNPWEVARTMMTDYGFDLNFNGLGVCRATPLPDPSTKDVVFDFSADDASLVTGGDLRGSLENTYNGVIATGEGTDVSAPVRAEVWDDDPASPTYWGGGFGQIPLFYSSPLLTSTDMATKAATTMLAKVKGRSQQVQWPSIVNPALEPLDVVSVTFNGRTSICVLDQITIPLRATDTMTARAREVSVL